MGLRYSDKSEPHTNDFPSHTYHADTILECCQAESSHDKHQCLVHAQLDDHPNQVIHLDRPNNN